MVMHSDIAILDDDAGRRNGRAAQLATDLRLPLVTAEQEPPALLLAFVAASSGAASVARLEVRWPGQQRAPLWVDLQSDAMARRGGRRRDHPLARAVGREEPLPDIVDATAGLGRDACVLAGLGYRVICLERAPVFYALLANGLERAVARGSSAADRMKLRRVDARDYLRQLPEAERPAVVYLDPMFGARRKSAQVKKETQLFHQLLGQEEGDTEDLFATARALATQRVVVKRPAKAPPLAEQPSFVVPGSRVRWDVYLRE